MVRPRSSIAATGASLSYKDLAMKRFAASLFALSLIVPLTTGTAFSDDSAGFGRSGLTFGIGLGGGVISCSDEFCNDLDGAGSLDLHVGVMLDSQIALIADVWWMLHNKDRITVEQGIITAAVRVWPINHLWLQGGFGVARAGFHYDGRFVDVSNRTEWVPAFQLAVGVEPIATDSFGLDISLRYGTGLYSDGDSRIHNASLNLGISFY